MVRPGRRSLYKWLLQSTRMSRARVPRSARFALAVLGRYRLPCRSQWRDVRIVNLRDSGVLFWTSEPLARGTLFEMIVDTPMQCGNLEPGRFRCLARITRTEPRLTSPDGHGVAAEFVEFRLDDSADG